MNGKKMLEETIKAINVTLFKCVIAEIIFLFGWWAGGQND